MVNSVLTVSRPKATMRRFELESLEELITGIAWASEQVGRCVRQNRRRKEGRMFENCDEYCHSRDAQIAELKLRLGLPQYLYSEIGQ